MTDDRYRTAVREALEPLVSGVGDGPEWDDLAATVPVRSLRLPGWALAGVAALTVLVTLGVPALLFGPSGHDRSGDGDRHSVLVDFSAVDAQASVTEWWSLVIAGDTDSASELAHPDVDFNFAGLGEWVSGAGETPRITVDDGVFGSVNQPQLCFAIGQAPDQTVGSAVFRISARQWKLWEIRTNTDRCVTWADSLDALDPDASPERQAAILAERITQAVADRGFCQESSTTADFDGDGNTDAVAVGAMGCDGPVESQAWTMVVAWGNGNTESWPLNSCGIALPENRVESTGICHVMAAPDLNGDGQAELIVKVQQAAGSISLFQIYMPTPEEMDQEPVEVAPGGPGPNQITPGQIFVGTFGSSSGYEQNIRCVADVDEDTVFLMTTAESQGNGWSVFEGTWHLQGGLVSFLEQRTYSVAKDTLEASNLIVGQGICGDLVLNP